ncbi:hypothetical protein GCM10022240_18860 [Microbacterium kribbense]|uniref:HNH nuclease domain-containing protein n=2 Tax=Microbacterium kribbense TaxID=433645 RepID=A0ABP7GK42_9MICO
MDPAADRSGAAPFLDAAALAVALAEHDDYVASQGGPDEGERLLASGAVHDGAVDAFADALARSRVDVAEQYALAGQIIGDAMACPDPWCGPDPTRDPHWRDPRDRTAAQVRAERVEMAERAAVCDLAVRARMSEWMIRTRANTARNLQASCPKTWAAFRAGLVDERNAETIAGLAVSLPDDEGVRAAFDDAAASAGSRLTPGKFRTYARALRERLHPESVDDRHRRSRADRGAWLAAELDGMATFSVYGPAAELHAVHARVDAGARHLHAQDGEARTLTQLRADVAIGLLHGTDPAHTAPAMAGPSVAITIPALTLLGHGDEPAILDGYGPIPLDDAKHLAGDATSWVRVLTHPVTGTILNLDRSTYRVPKDLRRWLGARDPVCTMPGCGRLARDCQIDHRIEWAEGGATSAGNTGPLCHPHHRMKTETRWRFETDPDTGEVRWLSPTGHSADLDPPPW